MSCHSMRHAHSLLLGSSRRHVSRARRCLSCRTPYFLTCLQQTSGHRARHAALAVCGVLLLLGEVDVRVAQWTLRPELAKAPARAQPRVHAVLCGTPTASGQSMHAHHSGRPYVPWKRCLPSPHLSLTTDAPAAADLEEEAADEDAAGCSRSWQMVQSTPHGTCSAGTRSECKRA